MSHFTVSAQTNYFLVRLMYCVVILLFKTVCQQFFLLTLTQTSNSISRTLTKATLDSKGKKSYRICLQRKYFLKTVLKYLYLFGILDKMYLNSQKRDVLFIRNVFVALVYFRDSHMIVTRSISMDVFIDYIMRDFSLPPPCRCTLLEYYAA